MVEFQQQKRLAIDIHILHFSALQELWRMRGIWRNSKPQTAAAGEDSSTGKRRGGGGFGIPPTEGSASFSSKLSLMLIFPLIESQTR